MKIAVIGSIVQDTIYPYNGAKTESLGGIYYTLSFLTNLFHKKNEIYPICNIGYDLYPHIHRILKRFKNVKTEGIYKVDQKSNKVILKYVDAEKREEYAWDIAPPLTLEQLRPFFKCDVLLINFISGFELELETLEKIRHEYNSLIYMDFHSLASGIAEDGRRVPRAPKNWQKWIPMTDILQMNEEEARTLAGRNLIEMGDLIKFGKSLLSYGIKAFNLTLGSRGSLLLCWKDKKVVVEKLHPLPLEKVVDATGCGDAFAAGFICKYWQTRDFLLSAKFANLVAGINCILLGTEEVTKITEFIAANEKKYFDIYDVS